MIFLQVSAFSRAQRYVGQIIEQVGAYDHPLIQWWLSLCGFGLNAHDEIAWCSAFVNGIAWDLRLPRSKSAAARSWLTVGEVIPLEHATIGFDVVVLQRGSGAQPGPDILNAPGHVGFFAGMAEDGRVMVLGGNQSNGVTVAPFERERVLGIRRLRA